MFIKTLPFTTRIVTVAVVAVLNGMSANSYANESPSSLEVIEVTAQKRLQNQQDVPVAVTALSGDWLNQTISFDLFDMQGYAPSFSGYQAQSAANTSFAIRGIGTSSQNYGFESSVGLYVDGIYRARQTSVINDLFDITSIEILRGPQGTLFGKNTPSGAVVMHSTKPSHDDHNGFARLTVGNDNLRAFSAASSFSIVEDELAVRVGGFSTTRDGLIDDIHFGDNTLNDRDRSGVKLQALYTPTDTMTFHLIADYAELDEVCCAALTWQDNRQALDVPNQFGTDTLLSLPPFNGNLFTREEFYDGITALNQLPRSSMKDKGVSLQFDWQLNSSWQLTSLTGVREFDSEDDIDSDFSDVALLRTKNVAKQDAISQEIRLQYRSDNTSALLGMFYFEQDLALDFSLTTLEQFPAFFDAGTSQLQPLLDGISALSSLTGGLIAPAGRATVADTQFAHTAVQQQDSYALFAHLDQALTAHWRLSLGLRYTDESKTLNGRYDELGPTINGLTSDPAQWPNVIATAGALEQIASNLSQGVPIMPSSLQALAPFQRDGWGYFLLGTASVLPRPALDETLEDNQVTTSVRLSYEPQENTLMYAAFATGFKSGGINTDRISPLLDPVFQAETATTWEIGLKKDWPEYDLRLNLAAYAGTVDDYQATTFTGTGFNLQNAGNIETKGLEAELTWLATANMQFNFTFARNLATFDTFEQGTCWVAYTWHTGIDDPGRSQPDAPFCSRAGDRVGFEPQTTASVRWQYHFPLFDHAFTLSSDYQYTGDVFLDDTNDPLKHVGSYQLVNAQLSLALVQWDTQLTMWVKNLFDEDYTARNGFDVPVQTGKIMSHPGLPRQFGITIHHQF